MWYKLRTIGDCNGLALNRSILVETPTILEFMGFGCIRELCSHISRQNDPIHAAEIGEMVALAWEQHHVQWCQGLEHDIAELQAALDLHRSRIQQGADFRRALAEERASLLG